jgi:hypothetical protein
MRAAGRAIAAAVLAGLIGAAWAAMFYAWHPAIVVEFDRDLPRNVSGIHPPERDPAGLTFAWTTSDALIRLPGLDRRVPWTLDVRVRGARVAPTDNPYLTIVVDGANIERIRTTPDFADVRVTIPARPERRGVLIDLNSSDTFVPGPSDPRPLGVMLDRIVLAPEGTVLVPYAALRATSLSSAAMGAAIGLVGVTAGSAIGGAVLLSAGIAAVTAHGFAPFGAYPATLLRLSRWIAFALAALSLLTDYWRRRALRNTARFAAIFSVSALLLKLAVLLHPDMPVGDAMFHAHRFESVLAGRYYFTSIAPGGYAFPYPPGLYVFASVFASLVHRGIPDMALLRILTTSVDCAFGLLLYWAVVRNWDNRLAGALAVAIYHLMPLNFAVLTTGNLTNAFAQSVAIGALAVMAAPALSESVAQMTLLLVVLFLVAFLSHTGTVAILFVAGVCTSALFFLRGGRALRSAAWAIAVATLVAAVISVVVYYGWFIDTYRTELARIGHETLTAAPAAGGRTIGDRLRFVPYALGITIGAPVLLFAFLGAVEFAGHRASGVSPSVSTKADRLTLTLAGWMTSCLAFLVLGVLTPVDMRYYLAALPALAIMAGCGAAWAWDGGWPRHRRLWRLAAAVFLAGTISTGFHHWWSMLG